MTEQEIFEKAVTYTAKQEKSSVNEEGNCQYLQLETQNMCAMGFIMHEAGINLKDMIIQHGNSIGIIGLVREYPPVRELFDGIPTTLLNDLQRLHDNQDYRLEHSGSTADKPPTGWLCAKGFNRARDLAEIYELDGDFIDELEGVAA